ncbi:hypothetical protein LWI29_019844 [Acer saccharum]|uniref:Uncharacterized protein n=1 Tax=Acer saccharum TaxID=4024 RepID=A0AA39RXG3_ACESA|nr:hypothetical protein LWI29_019844 [Acer saccharum]KAK1559186.1 hypothetical protein Q3G72_011590 [Acer saccharum]KAK1559894.1 hypothetical protein Q3G72_019642 [Acer saccharum]
MMKSLFAFIFLFSLLLSVKLSYGRQEPAAAGHDYWKSIMKEQPMPKALSDLFQQEEESAAASASSSDDFSAGATKMDDHHIHVNKDFDVKRNAILYHSTLSHQDDHKD